MAGETRDMQAGSVVMRPHDLANTPPPVDTGVAVKSLTDLWMHQNALMWNRIQLLSAVQAGVLASNYVLHKGVVSIFLFFAAIISTLYLNYLWELDHEIRNIYGVRLRKLGFDLSLSSDEHQEMRINIIGCRVRPYFGSQVSLTGIFVAMIVVDTSVFFTSLIMFPFL